MHLSTMDQGPIAPVDIRGANSLHATFPCNRERCINGVLSQVLKRDQDEGVQPMRRRELLCKGQTPGCRDGVSAERAARAGLAILEGVAALNNRDAKSDRPALSVRVGIDTGFFGNSDRRNGAKAASTYAGRGLL